MAGVERVTIPWVKADGYRVIQSNTITVTKAEMGEGPIVFVHFTNTVLDMKGETFNANVDKTTGLIAQAAPSEWQQEPVKVLEITVQMRADTLASLVPVILQSWSTFSPAAKTLVREAIAKSVPAKD